MRPDGAAQSHDKDRSAANSPSPPGKFAKFTSVTLCLSTKPRVPIIYVRMKPFTRVLALIFLAAFAVSMAVHTAGATTMALKMASGTMDMGDCERCGSDDGDEKRAATCNIVCVSSFSGTLNADQAVHRRPPATPSVFGLYDFVCRTEPPDPFPPRFLS